MSRRPRSMTADLDLIAHPHKYIDPHRNMTWASGALQASIDRYLLLKTGATARLNRRLLIGHPERVSWVGRHLRKRRGWKR